MCKLLENFKLLKRLLKQILNEIMRFDMIENVSKKSKIFEIRESLVKITQCISNHCSKMFEANQIGFCPNRDVCIFLSPIGIVSNFVL